MGSTVRAAIGAELLDEGTRKTRREGQDGCDRPTRVYDYGICVGLHTSNYSEDEDYGAMDSTYGNGELWGGLFEGVATETTTKAPRPTDNAVT